MTVNEGAIRADSQRWRAAQHSREEVCWLHHPDSDSRPHRTVLASNRVSPCWQIFHQMTNATLRTGPGPALRLDLANVGPACQVSIPPPSQSQICSHSNYLPQFSSFSFFLLLIFSVFGKGIKLAVSKIWQNYCDVLCEQLELWERNMVHILRSQQTNALAVQTSLESKWGYSSQE